jgi:hypothetical protein
VAKQSVTYERYGTKWKVHRDLLDSPGLAFIQDYLKRYDLSKLQWVTLHHGNSHPGGWERETMDEDGNWAWLPWDNAFYGNCGPVKVAWREFIDEYRARCVVNRNVAYPTHERITAHTDRGKRKVLFMVYDRDEAVVAIVAHEVAHYLGSTNQIPRSGEVRFGFQSVDEVEAGEFEKAAVEAYRFSTRNVTPSDTAPFVTDDDMAARCAECGMALSSSAGKHTFCSDRCRWTFHNRRRSQRTAAKREKACEICGKQFTSARNDAKTCSKACRQKAYRQRTGA